MRGIARKGLRKRLWPALTLLIVGAAAVTLMTTIERASAPVVTAVAVAVTYA